MNAQAPTARAFADKAHDTVARLIEVGTDWADLDSAASLLEELKRSVVGKLVLEHTADGMPVGKAEHAAYASPEYQQHVRAMVEARRKATRARVRYDTGRAHIELMRSAESTKRAEMAMR
jgi:hypothetical protein